MPRAFWQAYQKSSILGESAAQITHRLNRDLELHFPGVYAEVSPGETGETPSIVLTCHGVAQHFLTADLLAATAENSGLRVSALKPGWGAAFAHAQNGVSIDAAAVRFDPLQSESNPGQVGVEFIVPSTPFDEFVGAGGSLAIAGDQLLATSVGERLASEVAYVRVSRQADNWKDLLPMDDLARYLSWVRGQSLEGEA